MDNGAIRRFVDDTWEKSIVPALEEYIRIPAESPVFDAEWKKHGHLDRAVDLIRKWCAEHAIEGMKLEVLRAEGKTPLLFMEVPGEGEGTVLLYGHFDKQPPMEGWKPGLGPWEPVIRDGKLYGRGGADDGYAAFASLTALRALAAQRVKHARCVIVIEGSEESGSHDLPSYIDRLRDRIGEVDLVVCLDSGCATYDQLWCTTSLRGVVTASLRVSVLEEGVHSGEATGIVPSSFRIARSLLSRIEDPETGRVLVDSLYAEIPEQRLAQANETARALGDSIWDHFPWAGSTRPISKDNTELLLNRTWRPSVAVIGADGLPPASRSGNVLRPQTTLRLSFRLAPGADPNRALADIEARLEADPPHGAKVEVLKGDAAGGWNAPPLAPWLESAAKQASLDFFGKPACYMGEGGTIPFMGMLGAKFPKAQFFITGVLGPGSNAHGPNEFIELSTARNLTACVASIVAAHRRQRRG